MIIIIPNIKYGSTYYDTFTMGVCSNYRGYFFECEVHAFPNSHYLMKKIGQRK